MRYWGVERQVVEPNEFRWIVAIEKGGKTHTMFDGFWVRDPATASVE